MNEQLQGYMTKIKKYWVADGKAFRYNGEHPWCQENQENFLNELEKLKLNEIEKVLNELTEKEFQYLQPIIWDICDISVEAENCLRNIAKTKEYKELTEELEFIDKTRQKHGIN